MAKKKELKELSDLPYYRKEYTEQLKGMGIENLQQLLDGLSEEKMKQKIVDDLDGVGPKIADHWIEVLEETGLKAAAAPKEGKEEAEVVEEGEYVAKIKPELTKEQKVLLEKRREMSDHRPNFFRQEWHRYQKLEGKWRKPRGLHSKQRRHYGYRLTVVSIGFRGPAAVRGLHSSGFQEVMVYNPDQLEGVDPKVQAVRIGGTVGGRKRNAIITKADEIGIRVLNR
ncbi:MAG: 50S ribosomal protein L32e [Methanomassiliicoccales archaeon PtaU1.Bin124]|nr:MAG: 50S ribosomal protein L32e [Methanomassiliicoccales archaeon PtaU1.Bin124]